MPGHLQAPRKTPAAQLQKEDRRRHGQVRRGSFRAHAGCKFPDLFHFALTLGVTCGNTTQAGHSPDVLKSTLSVHCLSFAPERTGVFGQIFGHFYAGTRTPLVMVTHRTAPSVSSSTGPEPLPQNRQGTVNPPDRLLFDCRHCWS